MGAVEIPPEITLRDDQESERGDVARGFESEFEMDEELAIVAMPRGLRRVEAPRRKYGVRGFGYSDSCLECRPRKCCKLDHQLDGLRALVPKPMTRREGNDSIVVDAYYYISTLKKQVEDLGSELLDDDDDAFVAQTLGEEIDAPSLPVVEVMRTEGVLEVRLVCTNRPGLLVDVMEAVESRGLTVMDANIACHNNFVVEYLSLQSEESVTAKGDDEEVESVKALLLNAI